MMRLTPLRVLLGGVTLLSVVGLGWWWLTSSASTTFTDRLPFGDSETTGEVLEEFSPETWLAKTRPLAIEAQRQQTYPGSELEMIEELARGTGYRQYRAAYLSEGLTIYGLLTIPEGQPPAGGWPIIIFNHGYIPPEEYRTTERYVAYQAYFARNGYITFKSDYRGHGESEGDPVGGYYSPAYTTDVLNAKSSVQKLPEANPHKVGFWGHSMGGHLTLRSMVIADDIDAGVIWGGVVGSYQEMTEAWQRRRSTWSPSPAETQVRRRASSSAQALRDQYGEPNFDSPFWRAIDPSYHLDHISGPIQLHHGQADTTVDWHLSQNLADRLEVQSSPVELYLYPGADHNLSGATFNQAMQRSLEFFDHYVKNKEG